MAAPVQEKLSHLSLQPQSTEKQPSSLSNEQSKKLSTFVEKCGAGQDLANDLKTLKDYQIVLLLDDSGSMGLNLAGEEARKSEKNRFAHMMEIALEVAEVASCFDEDGIDLYFLNQAAKKGRKYDERLSHELKQLSPSGFTPIKTLFEKVLNETYEKNSKANYLFVIATDGDPSDTSAKDFANMLINRGAKTADEIQKRQKQIKLSILPITSVQENVSYLSALDKQEGIDVTKLFVNALEESKGSYSKTIHVAKALLGPILSKYDNLDGRD